MEITSILNEQKLMREILKSYPSILIMSKTYSPERLEETINAIMKEYQVRLIMLNTKIERLAAEVAYSLGYSETSDINYENFTSKILYKEPRYFESSWFMNPGPDDLDTDIAKFRL